MTEMNPESSRDSDAYVEALVSAVGSIAPAAGLETAATRVRREASAQADPYNAVVRWVNVKGLAGGPLEGLRFSLKDSIAVSGIPLTAGSVALRDFVPSGDATVTHRLLEAGATIAATTNMDDLAFSGAGDTSAYGPVINPHDSSRVAGGSSGGAAASLFLDGIDVALGTDQGGSVRLPAAWTGTYGLKPTFGRIPYTGIVGMDARLDHVGILARSPQLISRTLAVLTGPDRLDARQSPAYEDVRPSARGFNPGERPIIVRVVRSAMDRAEPRITEAVEQRLSDWARRGIAVEQSDLDLTAHGPISTAIFLEGALATLNGLSAPWTGHYFFWEELHRALARGVASNFEELSAPVRYSILAAQRLQETNPGSSFGRGLAARDALVTDVEAALTGADFLVLPTSPVDALPISPHITDVERTSRGWDVLANTGAFNVTGHPALSIPINTPGLPVGAMLVARHHHDEELLDFARWASEGAAPSTEG